jgi:hypothetical protein
MTLIGNYSKLQGRSESSCLILVFSTTRLNQRKTAAEIKPPIHLGIIQGMAGSNKRGILRYKISIL